MATIMSFQGAEFMYIPEVGYPYSERLMAMCQEIRPIVDYAAERAYKKAYRTTFIVRRHQIGWYWVDDTDYWTPTRSYYNAVGSMAVQSFGSRSEANALRDQLNAGHRLTFPGWQCIADKTPKGLEWYWVSGHIHTGRGVEPPLRQGVVVEAAR
jgi:hypothetical protein